MTISKLLLDERNRKLLGPLLKNLPLLAAILLLHEFEKPIDRRP